MTEQSLRGHGLLQPEQPLYCLIFLLHIFCPMIKHAKHTNDKNYSDYLSLYQYHYQNRPLQDTDHMAVLLLELTSNGRLFSGLPILPLPLPLIILLSPGPHVHHICPRGAQLDLALVFIQSIRKLQ